MGSSSLGARKFAATSQAARKLLRCDVARPLRGAPTTVAQRGRAGHEFFAFPYLPLWVGEWGLNPPRWQSGCVWVGQLCGDSACGAGGWVRGGGVGALAPVELWVLGPLAGWLGLAVRGWVTWHDLPAGSGSGWALDAGLASQLLLPIGLCRGSRAASAGMASAAQCMGDPGRAEAGDGRVARARGAGRGHPWRRPAP